MKSFGGSDIALGDGSDIALGDGSDITLGDNVADKRSRGLSRYTSPGGGEPMNTGGLSSYATSGGGGPENVGGLSTYVPTEYNAGSFAPGEAALAHVRSTDQAGTPVVLLEQVTSNEGLGIDWNDVYTTYSRGDSITNISPGLDLNQYDWSHINNDPKNLTMPVLINTVHNQNLAAGINEEAGEWDGSLMNIFEGSGSGFYDIPHTGGSGEIFSGPTIARQYEYLYGGRDTMDYAGGRFLDDGSGGDWDYSYEYAEGGEVKNGQNDELQAAAIAALDEDSGMPLEDRQAILVEFENVHGPGSVEELIAEIDSQAEFSGEVEGPGTGTSDSVPATVDGDIPAALSDGEYVIKASDVKDAFGRGDRDAGVQQIEQIIAQARRLGGNSEGVA